MPPYLYEFGVLKVLKYHYLNHRSTSQVHFPEHHTVSFPSDHVGEMSSITRSESFHKEFFSFTYIKMVSSHEICSYRNNFFFYCCSVTVVPISPCCSPLPRPALTPTVNPHPVVPVSGSFIPVPSPSCLPYPSSSSPLVTVSLFLVSMSLVLFCSLVCFVY